MCFTHLYVVLKITENKMMTIRVVTVVFLVKCDRKFHKVKVAKTTSFTVDISRLRPCCSHQTSLATLDRHQPLPQTGMLFRVRYLFSPNVFDD